MRNQIMVIVACLALIVIPLVGQAQTKVQTKGRPTQERSKDSKKSSDRAKRGAKKKEKTKVDKLFDQMHDLNYTQVSFPKLSWDDIPDLVKRLDSVHTLKSFPTNPLSSQMFREVKEGVVAAWLIEGIRKGGRYPSLGPSVHEGRIKVEAGKVASAYKAWWKKVKSKKSKDAQKVDPFQGTSFRWY